MNAVKKTLVRTQQFVVDHKVALAVTATAAVTVVAMRKLQGGALQEAYDFIEAKGLTTDFIENAGL